MKHFQPPEYDPVAPFLMAVQDMFSHNEHAVVVGRAARGTPQPGDSVDIIGDDSQTRSNRITHTKAAPFAVNPPNMALELESLSVSEIERGMLLAAPGSVSSYRRFRADIYLLTLAESPYATVIPLEPATRPRLYLFERDRYAQIILPEGTPALMPGQEMNLLVELRKAQGLIEGVPFMLGFDPPGGWRRFAGEGRITELID